MLLLLVLLRHEKPQASGCNDLLLLDSFRELSLCRLSVCMSFELHALVCGILGVMICVCGILEYIFSICSFVSSYEYLLL